MDNNESSKKGIGSQPSAEYVELQKMRVQI